MAASVSASVDPRYPIGQCVMPEVVGPAEIHAAIATIEGLPKALRAAVDGFSEAQIDTPYREGGWTVRQLVHHIADSHMNAFIRVRLALTEESPVVTGYDEKAWAELADSKGPIELPLMILEGVHARWTTMLRSLNETQWQREFRHPERGPSSVAAATLLYQWHCLHHTAHITELRRRQGW
jgi:DinB superfamily